MFLDGCSGLCLVNLSGGWLILGWCCGFEIWDGADRFEICGCADLSFFFFFFKGGVGGYGFVPVVNGRCCCCWWPLLW